MVDAPEFVVGDPVTAADLNALSAGIGRTGAVVKCVHSYTTDAATVNVGASPNTWSELEDVGGFASTGSDTTPIQVPAGQDGLYAITANAIWSQAITGRTFIDIKIAGTTVLPSGAATSHRQNATGSQEDRTSLGVIVPLGVGNTIAVDSFHTKGNATATTVTVVLYVYKLRL